MTARIGVFGIGLEAYWSQFPGIREKLIGHHRLFVDKLGGATVIEAGMVDNYERARAAGELFQKADVDIVFCHLTTYCASEALLPVMRPLRGVPVIVANVQSGAAMDLGAVRGIGDWLGAGCTCAGFPEMTAALRRFGQPFAVATGYLEGDAVFDGEIRDWRLAADAKRRLKDGTIGLLGRPYQGMMDLCVDESDIYRRFGCYVRHLNWEELAGLIDAGIDLELIREGRQKASESFVIPSEVDEQLLETLGEVYGAARRMVDRYSLIAMCNHFEVAPSGTLARVVSVSNPVFSLLTGRGIACPVEGDIRTAIVMNILKTVGGSATLAELYSMDFDADRCLVGHSGAGDPDIGRERARLIPSAVFHGKPGGGLLTQFFPAAGPVTLAALTQTAAGEYCLVVAEGEVESGMIMRLGDTNAPIRFPGGLRRFVNSWAMAGPTHHAALGCGRHAGVLRKAGMLLDVPVKVIGSEGCAFSH